jgi:hypothetical protein
MVQPRALGWHTGLLIKDWKAEGEMKTTARVVVIGGGVVGVSTLYHLAKLG